VTTPFAEQKEMVELHVSEGSVYSVASKLRQLGALSVSVSKMDYIFEAQNPLFDHISSRLKTKS
jgi:ATP phosphoribosyltransferase